MRRRTALAARPLCFKMAGMKIHALLVKSLLLAAFFSVIGPLLAQSSYGPQPALPAPDAAKTPAGAPVIAGIVIPRTTAGFLGLEIDPESHTFRLSFYDDKKNPIAPDVATAIISWYFNNTGTEKLIYAFGPGADGKSLVSPRVVTPPLPLRATIFLFSSPADSNPVESYLSQNLTSLAAK
jgi:hypothetical protein